MKQETRDWLEDLEPVHLLALTLFGESRGEPIEGKIAVANVINNRILDKRWPNTLTGVVLQPKQFSCWNEGDPNCEMLVKKSKQGMYSDRGSAWRECLFASHGVVYRYLLDNTMGANHYHTISVNPSWNKGMVETTRIGSHIFYRG